MGHDAMPTDTRADVAGNAEPRDRGSAMIITLMVLSLVTALSATVAVLTINNLQGSVRAQQAGAALGAADAGIAQAMTYLRNNGVRNLDCTAVAPTSPECAAGWGSEDSPVEVTVPGGSGQTYKVWIEALLPFPVNDRGTYRIHSKGTAAGLASREVEADVVVTTTEVPKGIFARTINGGGDASVARASIFSTGCVYNRSKIEMTGIDVAYGIPVAVHSSQIITESNGSGQYCPTTSATTTPTPTPTPTTGNGKGGGGGNGGGGNGGGNFQPIHSAGEGACNTNYPHDQDLLGESLDGTACKTSESTHPTFYYGERDLNGDGSPDVNGSYLKDDNALFALYDIRSPALTQSQLDQIKSIAQSQDNYFTESTGWEGEDIDEANAVMYFDLGQLDPGGTVDLNDIDDDFGRAPILSASDPLCETRSLMIVIDGGNVKLNSNKELTASVFLTSAYPHGQVYKANGTSSFIGTLYADTVNLTGTADLSMDECFLSNVSPALLDFKLGNYRELDRTVVP